MDKKILNHFSSECIFFLVPLAALPQLTFHLTLLTRALTMTTVRLRKKKKKTRWKTSSRHMWKSYLEIFICMSDTCTSSPVIGCGCPQALKVAGVHLIMARKGGQAHPRKISPLNIFMYQVGLFISSLHHFLTLWGYTKESLLLWVYQKGHF